RFLHGGGEGGGQALGGRLRLPLPLRWAGARGIELAGWRFPRDRIEAEELHEPLRVLYGAPRLARVCPDLLTDTVARREDADPRASRAFRVLALEPLHRTIERVEVIAQRGGEHRRRLSSG